MLFCIFMVISVCAEHFLLYARELFFFINIKRKEQFIIIIRYLYFLFSFKEIPEKAYTVWPFLKNLDFFMIKI